MGLGVVVRRERERQRRTQQPTGEEALHPWWWEIQTTGLGPIAQGIKFSPIKKIASDYLLAYFQLFYLLFYNSMKEVIKGKRGRESEHVLLTGARHTFAHVFMITIFCLQHTIPLSLIRNNYTSLPLPFLLSFFCPSFLLLSLFCFTLIAASAATKSSVGLYLKQILEATLPFYCGQKRPVLKGS